MYKDIEPNNLQILIQITNKDLTTISDIIACVSQYADKHPQFKKLSASKKEIEWYEKWIVKAVNNPRFDTTDVYRQLNDMRKFISSILAELNSTLLSFAKDKKTQLQTNEIETNLNTLSHWGSAAEQMALNLLSENDEGEDNKSLMRMLMTDYLGHMSLISKQYINIINSMSNLDVNNTTTVLTGEALNRQYDYKPLTPSKKLLFGVSHGYNQLNALGNPISKIKGVVKGKAPKKWNAMDVIVPGVVLGVIPEKDQINQLLEITKKSVDGGNPNSIHVFSIIDELEQAMDGIAQPTDLLAHGIVHHQVPMTDFGADILPEALLAPVYEMKKAIEEGGSVYIHCKAGRARSAMIVAAYLTIFGGKEVFGESAPSLQKAVKFLKGKRGQVNLHEETLPKNWDDLPSQKGVGKLQRAQEAIDLHHLIQNNYNTNKLDNQQKTPGIKDYIYHFNLYNKLEENKDLYGNTRLSTPDFKNELTTFESFKQLKIFAASTQKSKRSQLLREFFDQIQNAKDDDWFDNKENGPLFKLFNNSKVDNDVRFLINNFIKDIRAYKYQNVKMPFGSKAMLLEESKENPDQTIAHRILYGSIDNPNDKDLSFLNENLKEKEAKDFAETLAGMLSNIEFNRFKKLLMTNNADLPLAKAMQVQPLSIDNKIQVDQFLETLLNEKYKVYQEKANNQFLEAIKKIVDHNRWELKHSSFFGKKLPLPPGITAIRQILGNYHLTTYQKVTEIIKEAKNGQEEIGNAAAKKKIGDFSIKPTEHSLLSPFYLTVGTRDIDQLEDFYQSEILEGYKKESYIIKQQI